jgi:hypothetical protein
MGASMRETATVKDGHEPIRDELWQSSAQLEGYRSSSARSVRAHLGFELVEPGSNISDYQLGSKLASFEASWRHARKLASFRDVTHKNHLE